MRRSFLVFCFLIAASVLRAQKIYFVYLQTENSEPFFVRLNDKLFSSTPSGYVILSRLMDSTYNFKVGFPGRNLDLAFSITLNKKDHGYLIKDFGEKGWGLFDLQSLSVQMSSSNSSGTSLINKDSSYHVTAFTDMLAKATDDPSLKQNFILVKEQLKKPESVALVQKEEIKPHVSAVTAKEEKSIETEQVVDKSVGADIKTAVVKSPDSAKNTTAVKPEVAYQRSRVKKLSGVSTAQGFESVFIDEYQNGLKDTVRLLIPESETTGKKQPDSTTDTKKFLDISSDSTQIPSKPVAEAKKETKKWSLFKGKNESGGQAQPNDEPKRQSSKLWPFNKNKTATSKTCDLAGNDDFLKLRRKMAARTSDDGMMDEATKYFKTKCFTTEQIKNLSSMFLSPAGKFNFFYLAYDHVTDKQKFPSLESELKDDYYVNEFRTKLPK